VQDGDNFSSLVGHWKYNLRASPPMASLSYPISIGMKGSKDGDREGKCPLVLP